MATAKRIYLVTCDNGAERLVNASNKASAIHYCVKAAYSADVASQADLVRLMQAGAKVVEAGDAPAEVVTGDAE
jgi:hypothetical protein